MIQRCDCRHRRKAAALAMVAPKSLARPAAAARLAPYLPVATARSAAGPGVGVAPKRLLELQALNWSSDMGARPDYQPSRKIADQVEDDLVVNAGEAFFEDGSCVICGCDAGGERADGLGNLVHDTVIFRKPDGCRVIVALQCVACRRGEVSVCRQRKGWNEVALELSE